MKKNILFILITFCSIFSFSQKATENEVNRVLKQFLLSQNKNYVFAEAEKIIISVSNESLAYIFNYKNAFVAISADKDLSPIKAFSFKNSYSELNNEFSLKDMLIGEYRQKKKISSSVIKMNKKNWNNYLQKSYISPKSETFGPFLKSVFGQANCKNESGDYINVTNTHTPNNWSVGCVALTLATTMHYYKWPEHGIGSYSYFDNGSSQNLSANFENTLYQWDNILNEYHYVSSTYTQREALGQLSFQAAVALDMYFTSSGSSSNVNKIPRVGNQYFRYNSHYESNRHPQFWSLLEQNIRNKLPVQLSVYTSGGAGHAIVCDGIKKSGKSTYYHLNMGWWGSSNSWYAIETDFNAGGYSIIEGAVFDFIPKPELNDISIKTKNNSTEISWKYPVFFEADTFELQVKRNNSDWIVLNDSITEQNYKIYVNSSDNYKYRVRAKHINLPYLGSWSETKQLERINSTGFNTLNTSILKIFPQPAKEKVTIQLPDNKKINSIKIYTVKGRLIYSKHFKFSENTLKLTVSDWEKGVYLLNIYSNKKTFIEKLFVF